MLIYLPKKASCTTGPAARHKPIVTYSSPAAESRMRRTAVWYSSRDNGRSRSQQIRTVGECANPLDKEGQPTGVKSGLGHDLRQNCLPAGLQPLSSITCLSTKSSQGRDLQSPLVATDRFLCGTSENLGHSGPARGICRRTTLVLDKASGHCCEKRSTFPCCLAGAAHEVCPGGAKPETNWVLGTLLAADVGDGWQVMGATGPRSARLSLSPESGSGSPNGHIVVDPKSWPHDPRMAGNCSQGTEAMDRHIRDKDILLVPGLGCWVEPRRTTASWDQCVGDS